MKTNLLSDKDVKLAYHAITDLRTYIATLPLSKSFKSYDEELFHLQQKIEKLFEVSRTRNEEWTPERR